MIETIHPDPTTPAPWTGLGILSLYTAAILATAAWLLHRRDA